MSNFCPHLIYRIINYPECLKARSSENKNQINRLDFTYTKWLFRDLHDDCGCFTLLSITHTHTP